MTNSERMAVSPSEEPRVEDEEGAIYALPASLGQERFWALDQMSPGNPTFNIPVRFRLEGYLDVGLVERAFNQIVDRHESLRTTLRVVNGQLCQMIAQSKKIAIPVIDLRHLSIAERNLEADRLSLEEARRGFDLSVGPLLRASLLQTGDVEHILLLTPHHTVADYWSIGIISSEFALLYEAYAQRREPVIAQLPIQYADFALWQREQANGAQAKDELAYWQRQLQDLPLLKFPTDRPRGPNSTYDSAIASIVLPGPLTDALSSLARQEGVTFFNAALTAFVLLLNQYTGQSDIGMGTQVAGRTSVELEALVGLFINTVVLRADLSSDPTARQLLARIQETGSQMLANQNLRFEEVLKDLRPDDYPRNDTLFRVNFICHRDLVEQVEFAGIKLVAIPSKSQGPLYDLNVFWVLRAQGWQLSCEYKTALFEEGTIKRLLDNYRELLVQVTGNPDRRVSEIPKIHIGPAASLQGSISSTPSSEAISAGSSGEPPQVQVKVEDCEKDSSPTDPQEDTYAFPLTAVQERFWLLDQLAPGNPTLNMQMALRLTGHLEVEILGRSLAELGRRHEILRTTFSTIEDEPVQVIHPSVVVNIGMVDLRDLPESEREPKARQCLREDAGEAFDISKLPLIRSKLLRLQADQHVLLISMPHIICDGWSNGILERELVVLYEAYSEGRLSPLPEPSVQYGDFAHWQKEWLKTADFEDDLVYWRRQLGGRLPLLDLPADRMARSGLVSRAETETLSIPNELVSVLKDLCKHEQVTLFMLLLTAFKTVLYRYTGQDDILVGSPIAGRPPDTEGILGPFSYPICLRTNLCGEPTFRELVHRVARVTMEALVHKEVPFALLVDELEIKQVRGRNPLFQLYFLHQVAFVQSGRTRDLVWNPLTWISGGTPFDLHLATVERGEELVARLEYNPEMFEAASARRMLAHFRAILDAIIVNADVRISELPMATPVELQLTGGSWVKEREEAADSKWVVELFEERVRLTPDSIAVADGDEELTYRELNQRIDALARVLIEAGLGPGEIVGVCSQEAADAVSCMLAVMRAGGAYVWLPSVGSARESAIEALRPTLQTVVVSKRNAKWFRQRGIRAVVFGEDRARKGVISALRGARNSGPDTPACVRLTCGPAGETTAVVISSAGLLARVRAGARIYRITSGDRVAIAASSAFEEAIWSSLVTGASVVFVPAKRQSSGSEWLRFGAERKCSVVVLDNRVPSQLKIGRRGQQGLVPGSLLIVLQGEPLSSSCLQDGERLSGGRGIWISTYGQAETGALVALLSAPVRALDLGIRGAGVFLDTVAPGFGIRIVDTHLQPVPVGVYGEICVSGAGVCKAYLGQPQLTAARFVTDPRDGTRLFRSGDMARFLPDGRIEFQGATQRHLNVEGFRLHLGALDYALGCHPRVMEAVAVPSDPTSRDQRPNVYVVADPKAQTSPASQRDADLRDDLRAIAADKTPEYPQIAGIVFTAAIRRDINGRADPSALEPVDTATLRIDRRVTPPRDELESQLVTIWEEIFGVGQIGIHDNFFELGGHSILALRLFARIRKLFKQNLPLSTLFQAPTIEGLARIIRGDDGLRMSSSLVPIRPSGQRPPLYIISGLGGNVIRFHEFARLLDADQPVYALQPPGLDGSRPYLTRIEDMAAHYVREIKGTQPRGPYFIAGYSFGGLVTFEMGRALLAQGDEVGLLALLDAPEWHYQHLAARTVRGGRRLRAYRERLQKLLFGPERFEYLRDRIRRRSSKLIYRLYASLGRSLPQSFGTVEDINSFAATSYVPQAYGGRLTLFRTMKEFNPNLEDYELGWGSLAVGGVAVHEIPGDHDDITAEPNVRTLAAKLDQCLEHVQRSARGVLETEGIHAEPRLGIQKEKLLDAYVVPYPSQMRAING